MNLDLPIEQLLEQQVAAAVARLLPELVDAQALQTEKLYTVDELAELWVFNRKTVRSWLDLPETDTRKLHFVQGCDTKGLRVRASEANAWLQRNGTAPAPKSDLQPILKTS